MQEQQTSGIKALDQLIYYFTRPEPSPFMQPIINLQLNVNDKPIHFSTTKDDLIPGTVSGGQCWDVTDPRHSS